MKRDTDYKLTVLLLAAGLLVPMSAKGQDDYVDDDYEYESGEGYHEEEWYDPSDWFQEDDQVSYEADDWDYDYEYDNEWHETGVYGDGWYDTGILNDGWGYDYNTVGNDFDTVYGDGFWEDTY